MTIVAPEFILPDIVEATGCNYDDACACTK